MAVQGELMEGLRALVAGGGGKTCSSPSSAG
jgi:hypothetical protein